MSAALEHMLDALIVVLIFLVGIEIGTRLSHRLVKSDRTPLQQFVTFWLAGSDARVNYSRATAFFGIIGYVLITAVVLHKYEMAEKPALEPLIISLVAALAMLGINLGQFGITQMTQVKMAQAHNPPPAPTIVNPPAGPSAEVTVNTGTGTGERRDSGAGRATDQPEGSPHP